MRKLTATICLTIAILFTSAIIGDMSAAESNQKTKIHSDAKKTQSPEFLKKLRNSKIYNLVGKGEVKFSPRLLEEYDEFKGHGQGAYMYATPDGASAGYSWCRGNYCNDYIYDYDALRGRIRNACLRRFSRDDL